MDKNGLDHIITFIVFVGIIVFGIIIVTRLPLGYTESSIIYLAGVIGAGLYWVGRKR